MKKFLVILIALIILLTGCSSRIPTSQDPVSAQLVITRDTAVSQQGGVVSLSVPDELHRVAVKVEKGNIYSAEYIETIEPHVGSIPFEVFVPLGDGYNIKAAIVGVDQEGYTTGNLYEVGILSNVSINEPNTFITMQVDRPEVSITAPDVLYSGGSLEQFELVASPAEMIRSFNYLSSSTQLYVSEEPWSTPEDLSVMLNEDIPRIWKWGARLPQFEEPTQLYYRARVCALWVGTYSGYRSCFYYPDLDEDMFTITAYPYPGF